MRDTGEGDGPSEKKETGGPRIKSVKIIKPTSSEPDLSKIRRNRGRPPTTKEYVGLAEVKRNLIEAKKEELMMMAERDLAQFWTDSAVTRARKALLKESPSSSSTSSVKDEEERDLRILQAEDLIAQLDRCTEAVRKVTYFKRGYKGTSISILKEVATVVGAAGKELARRTQSDESRILREENSRLKEENGSLKKEQAFRGEMREMKRRMDSLVPQRSSPEEPMEVVTPTETIRSPSSPRPARKRKGGGSSPFSPVLGKKSGGPGLSGSQPVSLQVTGEQFAFADVLFSHITLTRGLRLLRTDCPRKGASVPRCVQRRREREKGAKQTRPLRRLLRPLPRPKLEATRGRVNSPPCCPPPSLPLPLMEVRGGL